MGRQQKSEIEPAADHLDPAAALAVPVISLIPGIFAGLLDRTRGRIIDGDEGENVG
jgi:hypothetical protein